MHTRTHARTHARIAISFTHSLDRSFIPSFLQSVSHITIPLPSPGIRSFVSSLRCYAHIRSIHPTLEDTVLCFSHNTNGDTNAALHHRRILTVLPYRTFTAPFARTSCLTRRCRERSKGRNRSNTCHFIPACPSFPHRCTHHFSPYAPVTTPCYPCCTPCRTCSGEG